MAKKYINYNGQLIPLDQPILKAHNRAFKYGDGLFETIRAFKGQLPFWEYHSARLWRSMELLAFDTNSFTPTYLKREIERLLEQIPNARIRLTVFRSGAGRYSPSLHQAEYLIEAEALSSNQFELAEDGLTIGICTTTHVEAGNNLSNLKTLNSLPYVLAGIYRQDHQLDECLLLNQHGYIAEASYSNLFVIKNATLYTPLLSEGCLDGTMRLIIIDICLAAGLDLEEGQVAPEILLVADEVFLTNAIKGIQWVEYFNEKIYTNAVSKFLLKQLNKII